MWVQGEVVRSTDDVVGVRLTLALAAATKATWLRLTSDDIADRDARVAEWMGRAAGHAFRAAELAYDAGARMKR